MAGRYKILIADDDEHILELVQLYLHKEGFDVITAKNGQEALQLIGQDHPDLLILDIMMPVTDGWAVCREVRRDRRLPVVMLTAKGEDYDKILGLELGADDYMTKPFNPRELVARIKAVLRRTYEEPATPRMLHYGDLKLSLDEYTATTGGLQVPLTRKEFDLLWFLAGRPNQVFSREQLLTQVWGYEYTGDTRTVDTHIKRLRHKLGRGSNWEITTVWAVGYKFEVNQS